MKQQPLPFIKSSTAVKGFNNSLLANSENNDCVVMSIASALDVSYEISHEFVKNTFNRKNGKGTVNFVEVFNRYLIENNNELFNSIVAPMGTNQNSLAYIVKVGNDYMLKNMTVHTFIKNNPIGTFIVVVSGHAFTIIDGIVIGNEEDSIKKKKIVYSAWEII